MREAQAAGKLSHQNVVSVHSTGVEEGTPWYSMEYVDGETLAQILAKIKDAESETETPFGPKNRQDFFIRLGAAFADVSGGLQHAHSKGVTHRDIKPSNLILDHDGRLRILDFGLARLEGQDSLTISGDVVGTPLYMSPEQARRKKIDVDHRTDIYSLGSTMYEAICGRPPFCGKDHADTLSQVIERDPVEPRKVNPRVPKDLETIVLNCLRKDAGDRYGTAEALGQDLQRLVRGEVIEARPVGTRERLFRRLRRRRTSLAIGFSMILLLALSGWLLFRSRQNTREQAQSRYEIAVRELAEKIASGRFSLDPASTLSIDSIGVPAGALAPVTDEDVRAILEEGALASVEDATGPFLELLDELPGQRDGHYHLARAYRLLGKEDLARKQVLRTLEIDPAFVPGENLLAKLGGYPTTAAVARLRRRTGKGALHRERWAQLWLDARTALSKRYKNFLAASKALDQLIELSRKGKEPYIGFSLDSYLERVVARLGLEDFSGAREDFAVAHHLAPTSLEPALLLGKLSLQEGNKERAQGVFERLYARVSPGQSDAMALVVSLVHLAADDYRGALIWVERVSRQGPRHRLRSYLYLRLENWSAAVVAGRDAVRAEPASLNAHFLLATAFQRSSAVSGRAAGGVLIPELLRISAQALRLDPENRLTQFFVRSAWNTEIRIPQTYTEKDAMYNARNMITVAAAIAGLSLSTTSTTVGRELFDDFADGIWSDCAPVCWESAPPCCPGVVEIRDGGGLCFTGDIPNFQTSISTQEVFSGDVTVHVQAPAMQSDDALGISIHANWIEGTHYWARVRPNDQRLFRFDPGIPGTIFQTVAPGFDLTSEEFEYELQSVGNRVELRVWPTRSERPTTAQISVEDNSYRTGSINLWGHRGGDACDRSR